MKRYSIYLLLVLLSLLSSCSDDNDDKIIMPGEIRYRVTVIANWTSMTHPTDYPSGAHFSPVIGMVHKVGASFFNENELASDGIEVMAETGGTTPLDAEINQIVNNGNAFKLIKAGGLSSGTSTISFEIVVKKEFPLVTLVSMIAPSPDWFVAIKNVNLFENNAFVQTKTVNTVVYDSGTDSGSTFTSPNDDTNPAENIIEIINAPLGNGTEVTPALVSIKFDKI